jgi:hypothetical protein
MSSLRSMLRISGGRPVERDVPIDLRIAADLEAGWHATLKELSGT